MVFHIWFAKLKEQETRKKDKATKVAEQYMLSFRELHLEWLLDFTSIRAQFTKCWK